jgi:6-phosphogluconolactonase
MASPLIIVENSPHELAQTAAERFVRTAKQQVAATGRFVAALSGGTTPRPFHRLLGQCYKTDMPWDRTHLFWVDERLVPYSDERSNFGAAKADFLDTVPIPGDQVHPMPVNRPFDTGAADYQALLAREFGRWGSAYPVFDYIELGVGIDGHTASLFPGRAPERNPSAWVLAVRGGDPPVDRLTLSFSVLNRARRVSITAAGRAKADVVGRILSGRAAGLPAAAVAPVNGELTWMLDAAAAGSVNGQPR